MNEGKQGATSVKYYKHNLPEVIVRNRNEKASFQQMATYETRCAEAWHLTHSQHLPMKKVAEQLKVPLSEAYEMLAFWKTHQQVLNAKRAASGAFVVGSLYSTKA